MYIIIIRAMEVFISHAIIISSLLGLWKCSSIMPSLYLHYQGYGSVLQSCHHYILIIRAKEVFFNHAIIISSLLGLWKCSSVMPSLYPHYQGYGSVLQSCHHYIFIISAMEVFFNHAIIISSLLVLWKCSSVSHHYCISSLLVLWKCLTVRTSLNDHNQGYGSVQQSWHHQIIIITIQLWLCLLSVKKKISTNMYAQFCLVTKS